MRGKPLRPTPKMRRPWLIWSTVAASSASRSGWQSGSTCTPVPIFIRLVRAAMALARVSGAEHTDRSGRDMDLGQPHRVETPALGGIDLLERGGERLFFGHPGGALKLVKHAELERHSLLLLAVRGSPPLAEVHPRNNSDFHIRGYNGAIPVKFTNVAYPQGILETVQNQVSPANCAGSTRRPRLLAAAARTAAKFPLSTVEKSVLARRGAVDAQLQHASASVF